MRAAFVSAAFPGAGILPACASGLVAWGSLTRRRPRVWPRNPPPSLAQSGYPPMQRRGFILGPQADIRKGHFIPVRAGIRGGRQSLLMWKIPHSAARAPPRGQVLSAPPLPRPGIRICSLARSPRKGQHRSLMQAGGVGAGSPSDPPPPSPVTETCRPLSAAWGNLLLASIQLPLLRNTDSGSGRWSWASLTPTSSAHHRAAP